MKQLYYGSAKDGLMRDEHGITGLRMTGCADDDLDDDCDCGSDSCTCDTPEGDFTVSIAPVRPTVGMQPGKGWSNAGHPPSRKHRVVVRENAPFTFKLDTHDGVELVGVFDVVTDVEMRGKCNLIAYGWGAYKGDGKKHNVYMNVQPDEATSEHTAIIAVG